MSTDREMPQYQSHKKVWALRIKGVVVKADGSGIITPAEDSYTDFAVGADYIAKHAPYPGGYFVRYEDGYQSFSPAPAFEGGYTRLSPLF